MREHIYEEELSSNKTEALFLVLTFVALLLLVWRAMVTGIGFMTVTFFCLFGLFFFYSLNYRTLIIRLTPESLIIRFGFFRWTAPLDTIETCYLDDTPLWRIGGAGIHFTSMRKRYRVMFNFLEYPRVVVALKTRRGFVWDIAFSTGRPKEVMRLIQEGVAASSTP